MQLSTKLNEIFAELDAEVLESSKQWAIGRVQALIAFKASDEYKEMRKNVWALYPHLHNIAGGKTWFNVFTGNSAARIEEFVIKNCKAVADRRNAGIAAKLIKAGVTDVVSEEFVSTDDGFNGIFVVNTNTGSKCVTINTIRAGGYNIQALHLRVLVKVK